MNTKQPNNARQHQVQAPHETSIPLSSKYLWLFLVYGIPVLAVLSMIMSGVKSRSGNRLVTEIADRFILNIETSIPTVISFLLMLMAAQIAVLIFIICQKNKKAALNHYWLAAALLLVALAYDEVAQVHESIPPLIFREQFSHHGWIFAGLSAVAVFVILFIPFLRALPRPFVKRLLTALFIFLLGALVIEGIGGLYEAKAGKDALYLFLTVLEESVELAGVTYLNIALVEYVCGQRLVLRFSPDAGGDRG